MSQPSRRDFWWTAAAWGFWLLVFLAICADVAHRPLKHNTTPTYRLAATQWWQGQDPYRQQGHDAFLYLPQAAMLFTPFTWGPLLLGEILWRGAAFGLFAYALVRLNAFFLARGDPDPARTFFLLTLLAVPSAFASLRNAQYDLPLAAALILAAAEIAAGRWNLAAFWLCLALALKPLAAVPLLLFGALYPGKLAPRLGLGLLLLFALPFLHWSPAFVAGEYVRFGQSLAWAAHADEARYSDLAALLAHAAIYPPEGLKTAARLIFAPVFLLLGWEAVRRLNHAPAAWTIGSLSAVYLMLFNPRTETCSYVFLGPFLAAGALACLRLPAWRILGWVLACGALGCACDAVPYVHYLTDRWLKPLIAVLFLPVLVYFIFRGRQIFSPQPTKPSCTAGL